MEKSEKARGDGHSLAEKLHRATCAVDLLSVDHVHVGQVKRASSLGSMWGILRGVNRKLEGFQLKQHGQVSTIALEVMALSRERFMLTIAKGFVLLTMQEGSKRIPVIHKGWRLAEREALSPQAQGIFFSTDKYLDQDGFLWEHRYGWHGHEDELIAFDTDGEESLILTLETLA